VLVTLVKTTQDCLKKLLKTVRTTRWISELVRQWVPEDRRTGDRKRPTGVTWRYLCFLFAAFCRKLDWFLLRVEISELLLVVKLFRYVHRW